MNKEELEAAYTAIAYRTRRTALLCNLTPIDAEELYLDCLAHFKCLLPKYDPARSQLTTFAGSVTDNHLINWFNHWMLSAGLVVPLQEVMNVKVLPPHNSAWRRALRLNVVGCVAKLSPLAQKVCDLHMDKLSLQEIAAAMNIAERTFYRKMWPCVKREFKLSWNMMGFNEYFTRTKKKGQNEMNMIQEMQLLGALVRDCHQSIDEMIAAGDVRVIRHLATSPDLGDHVDFLDFCAWCKRVKRFAYVRDYLVNGRVSEAAKAMSLRVGHPISTKSFREVLSWLVRNFPW